MWDKPISVEKANNGTDLKDIKRSAASYELCCVQFRHKLRRNGLIRSLIAYTKIEI